MKRISRPFLLIAISALIFLSGCVSLVQEITIREDGSGSLRLVMGVETPAYPGLEESIPEAFEFENLLATLLEHENVVSVSEDHYEANGRTYDAIQVDLGDVQAVFAEEQPMGPVWIVIDEDGGTFDFEQLLDMALSNARIPGVNLLDLSGAKYTVRLITPQILDTNGVQTAAGTSVWEVDLKDLLQDSGAIFLRADYTLEPYEGIFIPWVRIFPYIVAGFLATGAIAIAFVIIINTTRKEEQNPTIKF